MLTKQIDDVLPTLGYEEETRGGAMLKVYWWFAAALAALLIGWLGGVISRPAPPLTTLSALPVLDLCWRPGLASGYGR